MTCQYEIADKFAAGKTKGKVRAFQIKGQELYHWAMCLAYRQKSGTFLLNADTYSTSTSARQSEIRSAVRNKPQALIPFSALQAARVYNYDDIEIIHRTEDHIHSRFVYCVNKKTGERERKEIREHFLGETLFRVKRSYQKHDPITNYWSLQRVAPSYFVCGLDRNDDPSKRNFFLTELPKGVYPKTVGEALEILRPKSVEKDAPRQGEYFFQSLNGSSKKNLFKAEEKDLVELAHTCGTFFHPKKVKVEKYERTPFSIDGRLSSWEKRHWVQKAVVLEEGKKKLIFVQGMVKDRDHRSVSLKDCWHVVMRNRAISSFRAGGRVD